MMLSKTPPKLYRHCVHIKEEQLLNWHFTHWDNDLVESRRIRFMPPVLMMLSNVADYVDKGTKRNLPMCGKGEVSPVAHKFEL